MHRFSDLDYAKQHIQELYAEAEQYRLIKISKQFEQAGQTRWYVQLLDRLGAWVARWRCRLQGRLSQNLFPRFNTLALNPSPCACAPEPCPE